MVDPLRADIEAALGKPLNGDAFERAAFALLRPQFPKLVPLPGGHDYGLDGIAVEQDGSSIGLVCTTGEDALGNLRKNLTRHKDSGGPVRTIFFATSRSVSSLRRRNLEDEAIKRGFRLLQVFERTLFTELLYNDPEWRKTLLGLAGAPAALSEYPASRRSAISVEPVGRALILDELRGRIGDLVLSGQPGIGKTFILKHLAADGWGLFLSDRDRGAIADAVRRFKPLRIIVDDAHFAGDAIVGLRQLRDEIGGDFGIVATTWPGRRDSVAADLGSSQVLEVAPLTRDEIVAVVKEAGLEGPDALVRSIVDQAWGRPGLAVTLARMALNDQALEVASGDALLSETVETFKRILGETSAQVLALIALGGDGGTDVDRVAQGLRMTLPETQNVVRGLASGGTLAERGGYLVVMPEALRYPLVREMFFAGPGALNAGSLVESLPQRRSAIKPLVGAAHRGAGIDRRLLEELLTSGGRPDDFAAYATLGTSEAGFSLVACPEGRLAIAEAALERSPEVALWALMELTIGDDAPRHSRPEHPMRKMEAYITAPYDRLERRLATLGVVGQWLNAGKSVDVALEVLSHILRPGVEDIASDPGAGNQIRISQGVLPIQELAALDDAWGVVVQLVAEHAVTSFVPLLSVIEQWCYPGQVSLGSASGDEKWRRSARGRVRMVVEALIERCGVHHGLLARLKQTSERSRLGVRVPLDREFEVLFPTRELSDWRAAERRWQRDVEELSAAWTARTPKSIARQVASFEIAASRAGITYPRLTPALCVMLARTGTSPIKYLKALVGHGAPPDLLGSFLDQLVALRPRNWESLVNQLLDNETTCFAAVTACLRNEVNPRLTHHAVERCDERMTNAIEYLPRHFFNRWAVEPLLSHSNPRVRQAAVIGLRPGADSPLPSTLIPLWEEALIRTPADDYQFGQIFRQRPDLLASWLDAWTRRFRSGAQEFESLPHSVVEAAGDASLATRIDVLRRLRSDTYNPWCMT